MMNRLTSAVFSRALMLSETLRRTFLRGVLAWVAFVSPGAMAAGDLADIGNNIAEGASSGTKSVLTVCQLLGVCGVAGSILALKSMKNNPQTKPWMVAVGFGTGLVLIVVPEMIKRGQTQMGMTPVSVG